MIGGGPSPATTAGPHRWSGRPIIPNTSITSPCSAAPIADAPGTHSAAQGVATAIHYPLSLTQQPAYRELTRRPCPESEAWAASCVTVPCFPELHDDEVERVADALGRLAADGVADG